MIIRHHDGCTTEAILVSRTANSIRVAMQGAEDIVEFREINGMWVSEDCEPVAIEFAWAQIEISPVVSLDECICPPELASTLLTLLYEGESASKLDRPATLSVSAGSCVFPA